MAGQCKHLRKALHIFGLLRNRGEVHPARAASEAHNQRHRRGHPPYALRGGAPLGTRAALGQPHAHHLHGHKLHPGLCERQGSGLCVPACAPQRRGVEAVCGPADRGGTDPPGTVAGEQHGSQRARGADMPLHRPAPGRDMRNEMGRYFIRGQVAQGAAHGAEDKGCGRRAGRAENPACIRFAQERALQPGSAGSGLTAGDGGVVPLRRRDLHTDRGGGQVSRPADVSKQVLRHAAARRGAQGQLPHAEAHLCHKLRGYGLRPQDPLRDTGSLRCEHHTQHICSPLRSS